MFRSMRCLISLPAQIYQRVLSQLSFDQRIEIAFTVQCAAHERARIELVWFALLGLAFFQTPSSA